MCRGVYLGEITWLFINVHYFVFYLLFVVCLLLLGLWGQLVNETGKQRVLITNVLVLL